MFSCKISEFNSDALIFFHIEKNTVLVGEIHSNGIFCTHLLRAIKRKLRTFKLELVIRFMWVWPGKYCFSVLSLTKSLANCTNKIRFAVFLMEKMHYSTLYTIIHDYHNIQSPQAFNILSSWNFSLWVSLCTWGCACVCVMCLICIYLSFISAWIIWIFHFEMVLLFIVLISAVVLGFVFNEYRETRKSTLAHKLILTSYFYFTQLFQKFTVLHPISRSHQMIWIHLCACVCVCNYKGTM